MWIALPHINWKARYESEPPQWIPSSTQIRFGLLRQQRRRNMMARGYSNDLRARAVALVEEGESRREVARLLNVAASTAVRWLNLWTTTGSVEDKPCTGHSGRRSRRTRIAAPSRCQGARSDAGGNPQTTSSREEARRRRELCVALLRPPRDQAQKKSSMRVSRIGLTSRPRERR